MVSGLQPMVPSSCYIGPVMVENGWKLGVKQTDRRINIPFKGMSMVT